MIELKIDRDVKGLLRQLARDFGEDSDQATARLAVSAGREMATVTPPRGNSKKVIQGAIERDARRALVVVGIPAYFAHLQREGSRARMRFRNRWQPVRPDQLERSPARINSHIEQLRNRRGRIPRGLSLDRRLITTLASFRNVMRIRRKLAGTTKGGWIGAGQRAGRFQRGGDRVTIGKNFMSWAQKWAKLGRASRQGREIILHNQSVAAAHLGDVGAADQAVDRSWKKTIAWYKRAIKARERKGNV